MLFRELGRGWHLLRSVPKSLIFNLRYFPFAQAIRLPVLVSHRVRLTGFRGSVVLSSTRFGNVRLGFQGNDAFPVGDTPGVWCLKDGGSVRFGEGVSLGPGLRLHCSGALEFGNGIDGNANASFFCAKRITLGSGSLLGWNVLLMDHDFHAIFQEGIPVNLPAEINIGESVWLGAYATVLKGARIARGTVVGARAVAHGEYAEEDSVIAGNPARVVRRGIVWRNSF